MKVNHRGQVLRLPSMKLKRRPIYRHALESEPRRKLKGARPAGPECLTDPLVRLPERRWRQEIVAKVRHVADVKDIEDFADEAKLNLFVERNRLLNADVLR